MTDLRIPVLILLLWGLAGALVGCSESSPNSTPDKIVNNQCLRVELFQQCMKNLPAGPNATMYNDWDEVVSQCETAAYYQAKRPMFSVPRECRW
jgi:hypothetical protein